MDDPVMDPDGNTYERAAITGTPGRHSALSRAMPLCVEGGARPDRMAPAASDVADNARAAGRRRAGPEQGPARCDRRLPAIVEHRVGRGAVGVIDDADAGPCRAHCAVDSNVPGVGDGIRRGGDPDAPTGDAANADRHLLRH